MPRVKIFRFIIVSQVLSTLKIPFSCFVRVEMTAVATPSFLCILRWTCVWVGWVSGDGDGVLPCAGGRRRNNHTGIAVGDMVESQPQRAANLQPQDRFSTCD